MGVKLCAASAAASPGPWQAKEGVNLLSGKNATEGKADASVSASNETVIVSYFKPNVTLAVVDDFA